MNIYPTNARGIPGSPGKKIPISPAIRNTTERIIYKICIHKYKIKFEKINI